MFFSVLTPILFLLQALMFTSERVDVRPLLYTSRCENGYHWVCLWVRGTSFHELQKSFRVAPGKYPMCGPMEEPQESPNLKALPPRLAALN